jgi:5-methylcytosine-specific restriction endonuclease McrA
MGRADRKAAEAMQRPPEEVPAELCPLCGRPLGERTQDHHLVPKSRGGRETVTLHPICHQAIHANVSNSDLERKYPTIEALQAREDVARFLEWVADKDPDFHVATRKAGEKDRRGRR